MDVLNNNFDLAKEKISEPEDGSDKITQNEAQRYEEIIKDTENRMKTPTKNLLRFSRGNNTEDSVVYLKSLWLRLP